MNSWLVCLFGSGVSGSGLSSGQGHFLVGKTLYSHSASSLHPWVLANLMLGGNPAID